MAELAPGNPDEAFGVMKLIVPVSTTRAEVENLVLIPGGMSGNIVD